MKFDAKTYRNTVLKKYARGEAHAQLREVLAELQRNPRSEVYTRLDLHTLFAIPNPVKAEELQSWEQKIVPTLNKAAAFNSAKLLKDLLAILKDQGHDLQDPAFWGNLKALRSEEMISRLGSGIRQLSAEYPLGVVQLDELISRLEAIGIADVTEPSIVSVARKEGLTVVEPLELSNSGIPQQLRTSWKSVKKHTEFRTVLDIILFHRPQDIHDVEVVDQLAASSEMISGADIEAARKKCEQGRDTDALQDAQKFLGMLRESCPTQESLHAAVLAMLVDVAMEHLARGKPHLAVRDYLADSGVDSVDASRLVENLIRNTSGVSQSGPGLDQVREHLAQAQLADAERTLSAVDPAEGDEAKEHATLTTRLKELKARKKQLLEQYRAAVSAREFSEAAGLLDEAITIDQGDDSLPNLRSALPPGAPRTFVARLEHNNVILEWSADADETISYTLVRSTGVMPALPSEGKVLVQHTQKTSTTDTDLTGGQRVRYAVFATRDGKTYSDPATAEIAVIPPPADFTFAADTSSVQLTWTVPRNAMGILITQVNPDSTRSQTEVQSGSIRTVTNLQTGSSYRFAAQAIYLIDQQRQLSTETTLTVVPRGQARAVHDLEVALQEAAHQPEALATWSPVDGFDIELWQFPHSATIDVGRHMSLEELQDRNATRIQLLPGSGPGVARFTPPDSIVKIVALTVDDHSYLLGQPEIAGNAPQATDIRAEVFGDQINVSWSWPHDYHIMELEWREKGRRRTRRITRARYRDEGGAKISNATAIDRMRIGTVVRVNDEDSVPLKIPVPLPDAVSRKRARYSLKLRKSLFGNKVTCHIEATTEESGFDMPVVVVLKNGSVMPFSATDGKIMAHIDLDFTSETTHVQEIELGKQRSPYWVCLFPADADAQLDSPPTSEMKG